MSLDVIFARVASHQYITKDHAQQLVAEIERLRREIEEAKHDAASPWGYRFRDDRCANPEHRQELLWREERADGWWRKQRCRLCGQEYWEKDDPDAILLGGSGAIVAAPLDAGHDRPPRHVRAAHRSGDL